MVLKGKGFGYLVILALAIVAPLVLRNPFHIELLCVSLIFGILALSLDITIGGMGQLSFGHQAFFGLGAYMAAIIALGLGGGGAWLGLAGGVAFAGAVGFVIGFLCLRALRGIHLAIVTFGFAALMQIFANHLREITGGPRGLLFIPRPSIRIPFLPEMVLRSDLSYYYLVLAFLVLVIYLLGRFWHSRVGRAVASARENEQLASSIGISPFRYFVIAFTLACALGGLSGGLYAYHVGIVNPMLFGGYYIFIFILMVIIGGSGTMAGPVLGAFIVVWLPELMPLAEEYKFLIFGGILLAVIIFMRRGIYPSLVSLWDRFIVHKALLQKKPKLPSEGGDIK